ncbi:putative lipase [Ceratocystis lukuohia]|uniref:Lipase n=1 Tax=Ceratocystis lukuohia TaxID=2019550 RepID=A0ABR4MKT9_9PEZI
MASLSSVDIQASHLCVVVHGLWGKPIHMASVAKALRAKFPQDKLHLLVAEANAGSFTYDGIDRGGERVCAEIEAEVQRISDRGGKVRKFSMVGYSMGGLVVRYTAGLLYAKGFLDSVECMNFTTFATPHLGARAPVKGAFSHVWNAIGSRTVSMSGRQLFTIDDFRETGKPLLSVLADPGSIFISGLRKFKNRTLYANITNDRTAVYYTTSISRTDPYRNLDIIKPNFVPGYGQVVLDASKPLTPHVPERVALSARISAFIHSLPFYATISLLLPIGVVIFLISSIFSTCRSSHRIRLHELGQGGVAIEKYRPPLWVQGIRQEVAHAYEALGSVQGDQFLDTNASGGDGDEEAMDSDDARIMTRERRMSIPAQPTLALTPAQFSMIDSLDAVGWRKFPVWIHNDQHTHAAIIVRFEKETFNEGKLILQHFVQEEFEI